MRRIVYLKINVELGLTTSFLAISELDIPLPGDAYYLLLRVKLSLANKTLTKWSKVGAGIKALHLEHEALAKQSKVGAGIKSCILNTRP